MKNKPKGSQSRVENYHPASLQDKFHLEFKSRTRESNSPTSDYESDA